MSPPLCRLSLGEHVGYVFEYCCSVRIQGRPSDRRAKLCMHVIALDIFTKNRCTNDNIFLFSLQLGILLSVGL